MKIGIHLYFTPSFGGGERYLLTAAEALSALGDVDFLCRAPVDLEPFAERFALDLSRVRPVHHPERRFHGARDWLTPRAYDFFLALDNHLQPMQVSLGRRGALQLQSPPYPPPRDRPLRGWLRLRGYDVVICYSEYVRRWALRHGTAGRPVRVLYPPIDLDLYRPLAKKPIILSVGRFFVGRHEKKHALLIDVFEDLVRRRGLEGWELHLLGSIRDFQPEAVEYLEGLRRRARGLAVHFHVDASLAEAQRLYGEASIYWHATGFGVDEEQNPQLLEHFGMAVVEAMAAEAVPVVIGMGGPLEIIRDGESGYFWRAPAELAERTLALARDVGLRQSLGAAARVDAQRFGKPRFAAEVRALAADLASR